MDTYQAVTSNPITPERSTSDIWRTPTSNGSNSSLSNSSHPLPNACIYDFPGLDEIAMTVSESETPHEHVPQFDGVLTIPPGLIEKHLQEIATEEAQTENDLTQSVFSDFDETSDVETLSDRSPAWSGVIMTQALKAAPPSPEHMHGTAADSTDAVLHAAAYSLRRFEAVLAVQPRRQSPELLPERRGLTFSPEVTVMRFDAKASPAELSRTVDSTIPPSPPGSAPANAFDASSDEEDFSETSGQDTPYSELALYDCVICGVNNRQMVFLPCGHMESCSQCSSNIKSCPRCNTRVRNAISL